MVQLQGTGLPSCLACILLLPNCPKGLSGAFGLARGAAPRKRQVHIHTGFLLTLTGPSPGSSFQPIRTVRNLPP